MESTSKIFNSKCFRTSGNNIPCEGSRRPSQGISPILPSARMIDFDYKE